MVDLQIVAITTFIHTLLDAIKLYKILDEVFTPADVLNGHVDELKENIDRYISTNST